MSFAMQRIQGEPFSSNRGSWWGLGKRERRSKRRSKIFRGPAAISSRLANISRQAARNSESKPSSPPTSSKGTPLMGDPSASSTCTQAPLSALPITPASSLPAFLSIRSRVGVAQKARHSYGAPYMPKSVQVATIILAGGQGTRLHPLTIHHSKPAVSYGGRYRLID